MNVTTPPPLDKQEDEEMLVRQVAQPEAAALAVENPPVKDPLILKFRWTIPSFTLLNTRKHYSDLFIVGDYKWRIVIFPKGNNVDHLSMYLDVADAADLPHGWSRYSQFSLAVTNHMDSRYSIRKGTQHRFNARESYCGFTSFMPLSELYDPTRGYLVDDKLLIEAEVSVLDYWPYVSKKETGFVGLKNQVGTCYLNSLMQMLYHIPYFRKAVYCMPTTENDDASTASIPLALQNLFYKLQYSDTSVATEELTKSFGWDTSDTFVQHDVQELNRVLCEKLEDKMKGTFVEGSIPKLFEGHQMNYIECTNVHYKSTLKDSFYDLQLDVKGCKDVYASFDKYVDLQRLEGDNKYHADVHDLQDAEKGVLFIDFPPVLQLQLKRFEYDLVRDTMVKINDRYEFPLQLDLDREDGKYLAPDADKSVRNLYTLHRYKFDDERVTKEDVKSALEEQYGGEEEVNPGFNNPPFKFTKYSNAYMLVYIRESDKDKIICNVDEKDIAERLRVRLKKVEEEKEYKAQAHLFTTIKEELDTEFGVPVELQRSWNVVEKDIAEHLRVRLKEMQEEKEYKRKNNAQAHLFPTIKEEVATDFGVPVQPRLSIWAKRQYRPNRPLLPHEEFLTQQEAEEMFPHSDLVVGGPLPRGVMMLGFNRRVRLPRRPKKTKSFSLKEPVVVVGAACYAGYEGHRYYQNFRQSKFYQQIEKVYNFCKDSIPSVGSFFSPEVDISHFDEIGRHGRDLIFGDFVEGYRSNLLVDHYKGKFTYSDGGFGNKSFLWKDEYLHVTVDDMDTVRVKLSQISDSSKFGFPFPRFGGRLHLSLPSNEVGLYNPNLGLYSLIGNTTWTFGIETCFNANTALSLNLGGCFKSERYTTSFAAYNFGDRLKASCVSFLLPKTSLAGDLTLERSLNRCDVAAAMQHAFYAFVVKARVTCGFTGATGFTTGIGGIVRCNVGSEFSATVSAEYRERMRYGLSLSYSI